MSNSRDLIEDAIPRSFIGSGVLQVQNSETGEYEKVGDVLEMSFGYREAISVACTIEVAPPHVNNQLLFYKSLSSKFAQLGMTATITRSAIHELTKALNIRLKPVIQRKKGRFGIRK